MDTGTQNYESFERSLLSKMKDSILDGQRHYFHKVEKLIKAQNDVIKSQNEKMDKLSKTVKSQCEAIGTLDARLEIIYKFINRDLKDMEARTMSKLDAHSASMTNQFVYSMPFALTPVTMALADIKKIVVSFRKADGVGEDVSSQETNNGTYDKVGQSQEDFSTDGLLNFDLLFPNHAEPVPDESLIPQSTNIQISVKDSSADQNLLTNLSNIPSTKDSSADQILLTNLSNISSTRSSSLDVSIKEETLDMAIDIAEKLLVENDTENSSDSKVENNSLEEGEISEASKDVVGKVRVRTQGLFKMDDEPISKKGRMY